MEEGRGLGWGQGLLGWGRGLSSCCPVSCVAVAAQARHRPLLARWWHGTVAGAALGKKRARRKVGGSPPRWVGAGYSLVREGAWRGGVVCCQGRGGGACPCCRRSWWGARGQCRGGPRQEVGVEKGSGHGWGGVVRRRGLLVSGRRSHLKGQHVRFTLTNHKQERVVERIITCHWPQLGNSARKQACHRWSRA